MTAVRQRTAAPRGALDAPGAPGAPGALGAPGTSGALGTPTQAPRLGETSEADRVRLEGNRACADEGHLCCWRVDCRSCGATLIGHVDVALLRRAIHRELDRHRCSPGLVPAPRPAG